MKPPSSLATTEPLRISVFKVTNISMCYEKPGRPVGKPIMHREASMIHPDGGIADLHWCAYVFKHLFGAFFAWFASFHEVAGSPLIGTCTEAPKTQCGDSRHRFNRWHNRTLD